MRFSYPRSFLFLAFFSALSILHSEIVQQETTPEFEETIVQEAGKKTSAPLSEALYQLIQGISDQTFDQNFFNKIKELEDKKFSGEFVDHWENGQLKIKANFKEGKVDGHVHGWFSDGQEAFKGFFYENVKAGVHIAFYHHENLPKYRSRIARLLRYNFKGQLDGEQKTSEQAGRLKTLIAYKHGCLHGSCIWYNKDRKCVKDEFYANGKLIPGKKTEAKR